jgi:hypothetical protein
MVPGERSTNVWKLLPFIGMFSTNWRSITVPTASVVLILLESVLTVTVSEVDPPAIWKMI